ncbi:MAG: PSD1 and planctomycete cytochrome C domain-containing protein [Caldilineaceae bacterium]|nr:PSD1 and planctomycete cytochrome C domain-containing protein [Caldilineaceae bacterium]
MQANRVILFFIALSLLGAAEALAQDRIDFFEKKIRPVLVERCYQCHSAEAARKGMLMGTLQLDTREGVRQGGSRGPAVVPGHPDRSLLIEALKYANRNLQMPPGGRLPDPVIADFVQWVALGAPDPREAKAVDTAAIDLESGRRHWAFRPLRPVDPPQVSAASPDEAAWTDSPIDRFVLARLREMRFLPSREADRPTLIRRAYFDLIGLPPSPDEVEAFVRDSSAKPFRRLVDRLLASPHYGERWGRHWLDAARFGESLGAHEGDNAIREDAYRYRDAVIRAFNDDLPYDEFVRCQVAGAPESFPAKRRDLGMFVQMGTNLSRADNPNDRKFHRLDDMVSATGQAFLALTIGCARCHDHKIDPITAEEYYQLTAVFFDEAEVKPDAGGKYVPLEVTTPHLLAGGSWRRPVKPVEPGFLRVLMRDGRGPKDWQPRPEAAHGLESQFEPSKLGMLASWLTDVEHGAGALLARVIVNRLWRHHFGRGIVSTPNDFGKLGTEPTHPALLDWLASELIREGWQLKPIHRLIMNTAVYKQAAGANLDQARRDAGNEYLWHRRPLRMEAEVIRDHMLSVSGSLRTEMYGPSMPIGDRKNPFRDTPDTWRRSVYLMSPRLHLHPVLKIFDPPDNTQSIGLRDVSTTPGSTAFMLNAPFVWEQAERFAQRVRDRVGGDPGRQIESVYLIALSRPPTVEEREIGLSFLGQRGADAPEAGKETGSMDAPSPLVRYCHAVMSLNEFIYVH